MAVIWFRRPRDGERVVMTRDDLQLRGTHNVENVLAAVAAGLACGVAPESLRETVRQLSSGRASAGRSCRNQRRAFLQ